MTTPILSPEELAGVLGDAGEYPDGRPLPAVLDTACVRTGLHFQLANGSPPKSVTTARDGALRLFMEYDTLTETISHLPKFAKQFKVPVSELRRALNEDWLPYIEVVKLPPSLRQLDPRALAVRDRDADDYPAAALAALLSPCILLTHNYNDFGALGIRTKNQGLDAVQAMVAIDIGQSRVYAVVTFPALPVRIAVGTAKWASEQIGTAAWIILGMVIVGGISIYFMQLPERRERIKKVAGEIGTFLIDEHTAGTAMADLGRLQLRAGLVPRPENRSPASAILRELARSPGRCPRSSLRTSSTHPFARR